MHYFIQDNKLHRYPVPKRCDVPLSQAFGGVGSRRRRRGTDHDSEYSRTREGDHNRYLPAKHKQERCSGNKKVGGDKMKWVTHPCESPICFVNGGPRRDRTYDLTIKSRLLYQLS